jgi:hypothetical protein
LPGPSGALTDEERTRVAALINEKAQVEGDPCQHCGSRDTRVGEGMVGLPVAGIGGSNLGSMQLVLPVVCHNCGLVRYFHGMALGLVAVPAPEEPEAASEPEPEGA